MRKKTIQGRRLCIGTHSARARWEEAWGLELGWIMELPKDHFLRFNSLMLITYRYTKEKERDARPAPLLLLRVLTPSINLSATKDRADAASKARPCARVHVQPAPETRDPRAILVAARRARPTLSTKLEVPLLTWACYAMANTRGCAATLRRGSRRQVLRVRAVLDPA